MTGGGLTDKQMARIKSLLDKASADDLTNLVRWVYSEEGRREAAARRASDQEHFGGHVPPFEEILSGGTRYKDRKALTDSGKVLVRLLAKKSPSGTKTHEVYLRQDGTVVLACAPHVRYPAELAAERLDYQEVAVSAMPTCHSCTSKRLQGSRANTLLVRS